MVHPAEREIRDDDINYTMERTKDKSAANYMVNEALADRTRAKAREQARND